MKILIIAANPFSTTHNNGKTLRSFFCRYQKDELAMLYCNPFFLPEFSICENYYHINESDIVKSLFNREAPGGKILPDFQYLKISPETKSASQFVKYRIAQKMKSIPFIRELIWDTHLWDTEDLNRWIRDFKPEIIFSTLGSSFFLHRIARKLSMRYNIPLAIYFTDDYVVNDYSTNIFEYIHHKHLVNEYKKTIKQSNLRYVIGEKMAKVYKQYFKCNFGILINAIDFTEFNPSPSILISQNEEINFSYIGGLHLNRWKSLCKLGDALNKIPNTRFRVFSNSRPENVIIKAFNNSNIEYCGRLTSDEVKEQIVRSHFLIHAESFDSKDIKRTQYSISTKIPEYLSSNRRIICIGPDNIASVELLKHNNFCVYINQEDSIDDICDKIDTGIREYNNYNFESQLQYAYDNFNSEIMIRKLYVQLLAQIGK